MTLAVDGQRLWTSLEQVSQFGHTAAGGLHRLAGSAEDGEARDYVVAHARAMGCTLRVDAIGNVFLRRGGPGQAILIGSHIDSQPMAGRYDGPYGVIAALEVLRTLHDANLTTRQPVEAVIWTNEEGARFPPAMMGSACYAGKLPVEQALNATDTDGLMLDDCLRDIGYLGIDRVPPSDHLCYLELHIEQGPELQDSGNQVGVVTSVQGMRWTRLHLTGQPGHSGTYPMERRRDALVAAAQVVTAVDAIGRSLLTPGRATVGRLDVYPNSPNVIPGQVELTVEFRHPDTATLDAMDAALDGALRELNVDVRKERLLESPPVRFDGRLIDLVEQAAGAAGTTSQRMVSGAGHDACQTAAVLPTAMIFIPCEQGLSHAEAERITPQWATDGANVLLQAVLLADELMASR